MTMHSIERYMEIARVQYSSSDNKQECFDPSSTVSFVSFVGVGVVTVRRSFGWWKCKNQAYHTDAEMETKYSQTLY